jgi:hypothetical protein
MELDDIPLITYDGYKHTEDMEKFLEEAPEEIIDEINHWKEQGLYISLDGLALEEEEVKCGSCGEIIEKEIQAKINPGWITPPYPLGVLCTECLKKIHTDEVNPEIVMRDCLAETLEVYSEAIKHPEAQK